MVGWSLEGVAPSSTTEIVLERETVSADDAVLSTLPAPVCRLHRQGAAYGTGHTGPRV